MRFRIMAAAMALMAFSPLLAEVPLDPGQTATVRLSLQRDLVYPVQPPFTQPPANHGAILGIDIDEAGRYHVALNGKGWIEVIRDGKAVEAAGHSHAEPGSGVAKIVDFDLVPGHYVITLSGMNQPTADITVSRQ